MPKHLIPPPWRIYILYMYGITNAFSMFSLVGNIYLIRRNFKKLYRIIWIPSVGVKWCARLQVALWICQMGRHLLALTKQLRAFGTLKASESKNCSMSKRGSGGDFTYYFVLIIAVLWRLSGSLFKWVHILHKISLHKAKASVRLAKSSWQRPDWWVLAKCTWYLLLSNRKYHLWNLRSL